MPEGQVSHRNAGRLTALTSGPLTRVETPHPRLGAQLIPERLAGDRVARAEAVGKHHLLHFESGRRLHSHLRMSGAWIVRPAGRGLPGGDLYLALWTESACAGLYRCPATRLLEPHEPRPGPIAALGPDLLALDVDPGPAMARRLAACDPDRAIGDALLDQRVVAGLGNVYRAETLFLAGIHPWRPVGQVSTDDAHALGATAAELMRAGVREGGKIRTHTPHGAGAPGPRSHWAYGRAGRPCRRCGTPIESRGQGSANRTAYWCPGCQR